MNKFFIDGRVGREPETAAVTSTGKKCTNFSVAVKMTKDQTMWLDIQAWDKLADFVNGYVHQATFVVVEGHINKYKYNGQDGKTKYVTNFVADRIDLGGGKQQQQKPTPRPVPLQEPEQDLETLTPQVDIDPSDLPF